MLRILTVVILLVVFIAPAYAQQRGSGRRGAGTQVRQRIHQPGTGQQTGTAMQKRDRKRDGTGVNCANGPCLQQQQTTQTQTQTQTRAQSQTRTQLEGEQQAQTQTKSQVRTQTEATTQTGKPTPQE